MATITLTSGCTNNISQALSFESNHRLRDASFSSYLPSSDETFASKFADPSQELNPTSTKPHEHHLLLGRKKVEDGEIGVFTAEKYFNGGIDEENTKVAINCQPVKDEHAPTSPAKSKLNAGTPSILSESSWNSNNALLQNPPLRKASGRQKLGKKSFLASFGCNCYCNDKNSVDIEEQADATKSNSKGSTSSGVLQGNVVLTEENVMNGWDTGDLARNKSHMSMWTEKELCRNPIEKRGPGLGTEECFNIPHMTSKPGDNLTVKVHTQKDEQDGKQRKSIEVFGSPAFPRTKKSSGLEDGVKILTWEGNDSGSDASSDLFEIESFTANSNPFLLRQSLDGLSSCITPRTCYAPSEASIEWSVVTASAADFSVISDSEDQFSSSAPKNPQKLLPKEAEKRRSGILLGCKSHKAVTVAEFAHRTSGKEVTEPRKGQTKFQAKFQTMGFNPGSLTMSHSDRISHPLYIQ